MSDWQTSLAAARKAATALTDSLAALNAMRDEATAQIARLLRAESGIEIDVDAIQATLERPYTLLPINEHEANLIHWRGIKLPIFGWVVKHEPAFMIARVSRSMDLVTPLPAWMKEEMNWRAPEHTAVIDGTRTALRMLEGDESTFKRKYGSFLGGKGADGAYKIKGGGAWIKLVAALIRDGILPYQPKPVAKEHWKENAALPDLIQKIFAERPFLQRAVDEFRAKGAVLVNYPPGAGKTMLACAILNHFVGKVLILGDSTMLVEQWRARVKALVSNTDVRATISTYQGAGKYLKEHWDLIIPDEAQRLPANEFSRLAFVDATYRLGLTGTPWREDNRQHMITALCGFPVAIRWAELIQAGILKRPRVIVATVQNDAAKSRYIQSLIAKRHGGRALVFCDFIEQGKELARDLDVPFIFGETAKKFERVQETEVAVISRVGDRGLDLPDLTLVIEVAFLGKSREQEAQRLGRLLHGQAKGEHYIVFTVEEAQKYRARLFGIEAELAGAVDLEFISVGNVPTAKQVESTTVKPRKAERQTAVKPGDEAGAALTSPAIRRLILDHEKNLGATRRGYMAKAFRILWKAGGSSEELRLREGKSIKSWEPYSAALNMLVKATLARKIDGGVFELDRARIARLRG